MRLTSVAVPTAAQKSETPKGEVFSSILAKPTSLKFRLNQMKKISPDLLSKAKPITLNFKSFYQSASDANKACQAQDLHLFNLEKIYYEKKLQSKAVAPWRLPKSIIIRRRLDEYLSRLEEKGKKGAKHHITKILVGKEAKNAKADLERTSEQLALQKQQQDTRNFGRSGSIFS